MPQPSNTKLSKAELDALVEEAVVDAYTDDEQLSAFQVVIGDNLAVPFPTMVLGVEVTVTKISESPGGIVATCVRNGHRQAIGVLDLPLPTPRPTGSEWIEAYRHWAG